MNKYFLNAIIAITLGLTACNSPDEKKVAEEQVVSTSIQVLDFHSTHRCETCNTIEAKTQAVLLKYYGQEMETNVISFRTINVDEEENRGIAEEFAAFGTALFINVVKDGESTKIDLTEFAFMNAMNDDTSFEDGLRIELDKALHLL